MTPTTKTTSWLEARTHAEKTSFVDKISRLFDKFVSALVLPARYRAFIVTLHCTTVIDVLEDPPPFNKYRLHGRVVKGVGLLVHDEAMEAEGREFDPRPGHYI